MEIIDDPQTVPEAKESENALQSPTGNYAPVRFNAMKHGILSRHTVLPHEDSEEFHALRDALVAGHQPTGLTEAHLVEELAAILWRKRRVLQAEGAQINDRLADAMRWSNDLIAAAMPFETHLSHRGIDLHELLAMTPCEMTEFVRDTRDDLAATRRAAELLDGGDAAYESALAALHESSRGWWQQSLDDDEYPETAEGLQEFIERDLEPVCVRCEAEARHHAAIKSRVLGAGFDVLRLQNLARYETHLDRKFERTLGMLVKLREMSASRKSCDNTAE